MKRFSVRTAAQLAAPLVHAAAALGQGDVRFLGHQERGVQAPGLEGGDDAPGDDAVFAAPGRCLSRNSDTEIILLYQGLTLWQ